MQLRLEDIVNSHVSEPCLVLGNSPNMMNFNFNKFKGIIITLSDAIIRGRNKFKANYWISSNNEFPMPEIDFHLEIINSNNQTKFFFADSVAYQNIWTKDQNYLNQNLNVDWLCFDERHHNYRKCSPSKNCCNLLSEKNRESTIQDKIQKKFGYNYKFKKSGTVAEFGLMFALLFGCNPIYLQGIEIPLKQSDYTRYEDEFSEKILIEKTNKIISKKFREYYLSQNPVKPYFLSLINKIKRLKNKNTTVFFDEIDNILSNFNTLGKISENNCIDLYNLSEISNLRKVDTIKYKNYEEIL